MSLNQLAQLSGLSVSYINEIEKGKKYPKADKLLALAKAMAVDYDALVSLKLSKRLEPIAELLQSNILNELPLELFGIDSASLLELLSSAPSKVSAFIGTLIEIARNYNMSVEQFYLTALRTYQEMHNNYFAELEEAAEQFQSELGSTEVHGLSHTTLSTLLQERYGYQIELIDTKKQPEFSGLRSFMIPKGKRLLINNRLTTEQQSFVLAREVGYQYLQLEARLYTTALVEAESFEPLLNNYRASYFGSALIINKFTLRDKLTQFFEKETFDPSFFLGLVHFFHTTPETLFYRISNILPYYFGVDALYFLRIHRFEGSSEYTLSKEMHLARKHNPQTVRDEHYCRRWAATRSLGMIEAGEHNTICIAQRSFYEDTADEYIELSVAKPDDLAPSQLISVTMGIHLNEQSQKVIRFLSDPNIAKSVVGKTCERCAIFDCKERMAAPHVIQKKRQQEAFRKVINSLSKK